MKAKNYKLDAAPTRATTTAIHSGGRWTVQTSTSLLDFRRWRCYSGTETRAGRDDLLKTMAACLQRLTSSLTPESINTLYRGGVTLWFEFLDSSRTSPRIVQRVTDIDRALLDDFVAWLKSRPSRTETGRLSYATARVCYGGLRAVLMQCIPTGQLRMDCFPRRPFPDVARTSKPYRPYTKEEMQTLMTALAKDLRAIRSGTFSGGDSDRLFIYFLLIAARTGRNPTSLYEMERHALQPHPLKPDTHSLLTTYKRRGNTLAVQSVRKSNLVEQINILPADVSSLIQEVLQLTDGLIAEAPVAIKNRLWLYRRRGYGEDRSGVGVLSKRVFNDTSDRFLTRHQLRDNTRSAPNAPTSISVMRLRKTFALRMWELTGGDVVMTAHLLGNQPKVTDTHYLGVTPAMLRNHHFLGKCLEVELRGTSRDTATLTLLAKDMHISVDEVRVILSGDNNTGVGRCSSPLNGRYAPNDGHTPCSAFLHCFRCPNQVIMESDLHRLFSFYWLLVKERNLIGRNQWHKVYGWVIREIDRVIAPHFAADAAKRAKAKAFIEPHPMWRDRSMLIGGDRA